MVTAGMNPALVCHPSLLVQRPERAVPKDEGVAAPDPGGQHLSDADVVVARLVHLHQPALEPGGASVEERDPVRTEAVWERTPLEVKRRGAASKAVGEKLLRAGQQAGVEGLRFQDCGPGGGLTLQTYEHQRRIERDGDEAARGQASELIADACGDDDDSGRKPRHRISELVTGHVPGTA